MKINFINLIFLVVLLLLFSACATSFQHQKHKRTLKYIESNQAKVGLSDAYQTPTVDPLDQQKAHKNSSNDLEYASVEDGEEVAKQTTEIANDIQPFRSLTQQPMEEVKQKIVKFIKPNINQEPDNEEIAERYRQKSNIVMTFFFVALGIGIIFCFFLGDFLAFGAIMGSLFQMLFQLLHLNLRKKQIRYTENEEIKKRATRMKWLMNVMFLIVLIAGTALLLVSLFIL